MLAKVTFFFDTRKFIYKNSFFVFLVRNALYNISSVDAYTYIFSFGKCKIDNGESPFTSHILFLLSIIEYEKLPSVFFSIRSSQRITSFLFLAVLDLLLFLNVFI